ncbi:hypothetical protein ACBY01_00710 [Sphingomonas sp. ac-8]|uniref:hypothetical protein n=1 Tax=Sphingomonas sp. ac-8 TaxID=3242977 RepID=UPI003A80073E
MTPNLATAGALATLLLLAGCGDADTGPLEPTPGSTRIACAIGSDRFAERCFVERSDTAEGTVLTVRQPDGGFRRLRLTPEGPVAADGAEPVTVTSRSPQEIEVAIAGVRYRLPAELGKGA